jgi:hypothetical protein
MLSKINLCRLQTRQFPTQASNEKLLISVKSPFELVTIKQLSCYDLFALLLKLFVFMVSVSGCI